jgi:hypothetical protein
VNIERAFHDDRARPDPIHQIVFADKFAGRPGQSFDDFEGPPTNWNGRSLDAKLASCEIDLALSRGINRSNAIVVEHGHGSRFNLFGAV